MRPQWHPEECESAWYWMLEDGSIGDHMHPNSAIALAQAKAANTHNHGELGKKSISHSKIKPRFNCMRCRQVTHVGQSPLRQRLATRKAPHARIVMFAPLTNKHGVTTFAKRWIKDAWTLWRFCRLAGQATARNAIIDGNLVQVRSHRKQSVPHSMDIEPSGVNVRPMQDKDAQGFATITLKAKRDPEHSQETSMDFQRWHQSTSRASLNLETGCVFAPTKAPSSAGAIMHPMPALLFGCCHSTKHVPMKAWWHDRTPKPWPSDVI